MASIEFYKQGVDGNCYDTRTATAYIVGSIEEAISDIERIYRQIPGEYDHIRTEVHETSIDSSTYEIMPWCHGETYTVYELIVDAVNVEDEEEEGGSCYYAIRNEPETLRAYVSVSRAGRSSTTDYHVCCYDGNWYLDEHEGCEIEADEYTIREMAEKLIAEELEDWADPEELSYRVYVEEEN